MNIKRPIWVFSKGEGLRMDKNENKIRKKTVKKRIVSFLPNSFQYSKFIGNRKPDEELLKNLTGVSHHYLPKAMQKPTKQLSNTNDPSLRSSFGVFNMLDHAISKMGFLNKNLKEQYY